QTEVVNQFTQAERAFQNHRLTTLETIPAPPGMRRVRAGTVVVRTDQPLGRLATFLLEPMSEDGLAVWNFFDGALKAGGEYPVTRLMKDAPILTTRVKPLPEERGTPKHISIDHALGNVAPPNFVG